MKNKEDLNGWLVVKILFRLFLFPVFLFLPAGTLYWPEAWLFFLIYYSWAGPVLVWLWKNDPELLKERVALKKPEKSWDKVIVFLGSILFFALFLIIGFDVRYQWSQTPFVVKLLGITFVTPSLILFFLVMRENTYLSRIVEIEKERGHKVITSGPYGFVRHPLYVGVIILVLAMPLALGSLYAVIPAVLLDGLLVVRTYLEDKMLHEELPGYKEYAKKTRYRLLPSVW
jgi:protein-S-isoprenylcysteine O-methyltransferase Ste14